MSDLEDLLRSTLADQAAEITPDPDAAAAAVAAVQRQQLRRQHRRRLAAVLAAATVAGIVVVTTAVSHDGHQPDVMTQPATSSVTSTPALTSPTATATAPPPTAPTPTTDASATHDTGGGDFTSLAVRRIGIINAVLGPDYSSPERQTTSGWGDLVLTLGSPSAIGLPAGYNAAATASLLPPTSDSSTGPVGTLSELCKGIVEKGATTKPCVTDYKNGVTVYRSDTDAPNTKIGTWSNLRILYKRPDQLVVYTQITIYNTAHPTTAPERATAATWLNNQAEKLALAATTGP